MSEPNGPKDSAFFATIFAVLSAFVGIRKKRDYERDAVRLKPVHVIVAGIIGAVLFIFTILMVVKWLMANH